MKVIFSVFLFAMMSIAMTVTYIQTDGFKGCPLSVGDSIGNGVVIARKSHGSITPNCKVAVRYSDGSVSESYEYAWKFKKQEEVK